MAIFLFVLAEQNKLFGSQDFRVLCFSIVCDALIYLVLTKQVDLKSRTIIWGYNPIAIYFMLSSGIQDSLTITLLVCLTSAITNYRRYFLAGNILSVLCFINPLFLLSLPIILIYISGSPRYRKNLVALGSTATISLSLLISTFTLNGSLKINEWTNKLVKSDFHINIGANQVSVSISLILVSIFWLYLTQRTSENVFILFILLTTSFISLTQNGDIRAVFITIPSILIAVNLSTLRFIFVMIVLQSLIVSVEVASEIKMFEVSTFTSLIAYSTFLAIRLIRNGVVTGDLYKFSTSPISLAIAGDSGVGKDTFADSIATAFGKDYTHVICGDDYHRFERGDDAWNSTTHLNPRMNNLVTWQIHLQNALARVPYKFQSYDHNTGKFIVGNVSDSKDLVISQGLHALYPELIKQVDMSVYMEMDEDLRVQYKIERDSKTRLQNEELVRTKIEKIYLDFQRYVAPQKFSSDYIVKQWSTEPVSFKPNMIEIQSEKHLDVIRLLATRCIEYSSDLGMRWEDDYSGKVVLNTNNFKKEHVSQILNKELEAFSQMFPNPPSFDDGSLGVFQVLVFLHLDSLRKERYFLANGTN
jgi:uridine kinase